MTDYLAKSKKAKTPEKRELYLRLHWEDKARNSIVNCTRCPLAETRTNAVPWSGDSQSQIVLVGEAPGHNEDKHGEPFVGQAGRLLNRALREAGTSREEVMVMNTIMCRPPRNRKPTQDEQSACRRHYDRQLKISNALIGVVMGRSAVENLLGEDKIKISDYRGKPFWMEGRIWVPTFHPAYVLRSRDATHLLVQDLMLARNLLIGKTSWPKIDPESVDSKSVTRKQFANHLEKKGWALMYLGRLETTAVIVKDEGIKVPRHLDGETTYTLEELARIGEIGAHRAGNIEAVHLLKTFFPGSRLVG